MMKTNKKKMPRYEDLEQGLKRIFLYNLIKRDLKWDIIMSWVAGINAGVFYYFWIFRWQSIDGGILTMIAFLHFLLWFNSYLITKRNKQIMEVLK